MSLVAAEELDRLKQKQLSSYKPELRTMVFLKDEMDEILNNENLGAEEKLKLFQTAQHRFGSFTNVAEKLPEISSVMPEPAAAPPPAPAPRPVRQLAPVIGQRTSRNSIVENIPSHYRNKALALLDHLDNNPEKIGWNDNGELIVNKKLIPNSIIIDIVRHLYISKKGYNPNGVKQFVSALQKSNVAQTLISNKSIIDQLNSIPLASPKSRKQTGKGRPPGKIPRVLSLYKI